MSWVRRILWLLATLAGLLLLAGVWLWNTDLGRFEPRIESALSERMGRTVSLEGLSIEAGRTLHISAESVTIDNPPWATAPHFLEASRLSAALKLASLWRSGPVIVERLHVDALALDLAWNEAGDSTFDLGPPTPSPPEASSPGLPALIIGGSVSDLRVLVTDPDRPAPIRMDAEGLHVTRQDSGLLAVRLNGHVNDRPMRYEGALGPLDALVSGQDVRFDGDGAFGSLTLRGQGRVDDLARPDRPAGTLELSGPDLSEVERMLGLAPTRAVPYRLSLSLSPKDGALAMTARGEAGDFRLDLSGSARSLRELTSVQLAVDASGPDLDRLLRLVGVEGAPAQDFEVKGHVDREGKRLAVRDAALRIGDTRFQLDAKLDHFPHVRDSRVSLSVAGPELAAFRALFGLPGVLKGPFTLDLTTHPGDDTVTAVSMTLATGPFRLEAEGEVRPGEDYQGSTASFHLSGEESGSLFRALGLAESQAEGPVNVRGRLEVKTDAVAMQNTRLTLGDVAKLDLDGTVGFEPFSADTRLSVRLQGDNADRLGSSLGLTQPLGSRAFDLRSGLGLEPGFVILRDFEGQLGDASLSAEGRVPLAGSLAGLDLHLQGSGDDLGGLLADVRGTTTSPVTAADWAASLQLLRQDDRLQLNDLDLSAGDSRLAGTLGFAWPISLASLRADLEGSGPRADRVLPALGAYQPAAAPWEVRISGERRAGGWGVDNALLRLGNARLTASGRLEDAGQASSSRIDWTLDAPSLQTLGAVARRPLPDLPARVSARIDGNMRKIHFEALEGSVGASDFQGDLLIETGEGVPGITATLTSTHMDLRPFFPDAPPDAPAPAADDGRVIPATPLPMEALERVDLELALDIGSLHTPDVSFEDLVLDGQIREGTLTLRHLRSRGLAGNVDLQGSLGPSPGGPAQLSLDLLARNLVPNRAEWRAADPATLPKLDGAARLTGAGNDLRSLAGSLDGELRLIASEGMLPGAGLGFLGRTTLQQVSDMLAPGLNRKQGQTRLLCLAAKLKLEDGEVRTEPALALRTDNVLIQATGTVNLGDESLEMNFKTTPSKLIATSLTELVNPFVRIRGTLAEPKPEIDPGGSLVYGGAAAATGGLSILAKGLWDRMQRATDPCEGLRTSISEELEEGAATTPPQ